MTHQKLSEFKFVPLKFAWAAIHPHPLGTLYFIGGAFFGTFPTIFYRFFLRQLFEQGYTLVVLPFRFSLRHWSVALSLVSCQTELRQSLLEEAKRLGLDTSAYDQTIATGKSDIKEYWIGHSLGCKYIALLELLTDYEIFEGQADLVSCLGEKSVQRLEQLLDKTELGTISLYNQPSILLDPVISDLDNAIPLKSLRLLLARFIRVLPSREETFCLIRRSHLFALTSIFSFQSKLAADSIAHLQSQLGDRLWEFEVLTVPRSWLGRHLAVVGVLRGDRALAARITEMLSKYQRR